MRYSLIILVATWLMSFSVNSLAETQVNCTIPNGIDCEVSNSAGFQQVVVKMNTGLGVIDVVDISYPQCVQTATVSWDPIVPNFEIYVTPCDTKGLKIVGSEIEGVDVFRLALNKDQRHVEVSTVKLIANAALRVSPLKVRSGLKEFSLAARALEPACDSQINCTCYLNGFKTPCSFVFMCLDIEACELIE